MYYDDIDSAVVDYSKEAHRVGTSASFGKEDVSATLFAIIGFCIGALIASAVIILDVKRSKRNDNFNNTP